MRSAISTTTRLFAAAWATAALTACGLTETLDSGRVSVTMTTEAQEAPISAAVLLSDGSTIVEAAVVTIERIYLQGSDDEGEDGEDGGRVPLRVDPITTNLLTLKDDIATLVEGAVVPGGRYVQLRLVISGGYLEVRDSPDTDSRIYASSPTYAGLPAGATVDGGLIMPSYDTPAGLKIDLPNGGLVVDGDSHLVELTFDVSESFGQQAGFSGLWVMHPVITATDVSTSPIP